MVQLNWKMLIGVDALVQVCWLADGGDRMPAHVVAGAARHTRGNHGTREAQWQGDKVSQKGTVVYLREKEKQTAVIYKHQEGINWYTAHRRFVAKSYITQTIFPIINVFQCSPYLINRNDNSTPKRLAKHFSAHVESQ